MGCREGTMDVGSGEKGTHFENRFSLNADSFCVQGLWIVSEGEM